MRGLPTAPCLLTSVRPLWRGFLCAPFVCQTAPLVANSPEFKTLLVLPPVEALPFGIPFPQAPVDFGPSVPFARQIFNYQPSALKNEPEKSRFTTAKRSARKLCTHFPLLFGGFTTLKWSTSKKHPHLLFYLLVSPLRNDKPETGAPVPLSVWWVNHSK